ncbi:hypothetical protein J6590_074323 [Homalodisca vitripennis]|nr:hypothetical protein J6590_074323 [Homalodisca vitripennis]
MNKFLSVNCSYSNPVCDARSCNRNRYCNASLFHWLESTYLQPLQEAKHRHYEAANLKRVLKIQKSAVRSLANLDSRDSCRPAFKLLQIKAVTAISIQELILHVDKLGHPRATRPHCYDTRNESLIPPVRHRTALHDKKPSTMGAQLYNQLPASFKQLERQ